MNGIVTNICPKNHPNVGKYTIHGVFYSKVTYALPSNVDILRIRLASQRRVAQQREHGKPSFRWKTTWGHDQVHPLIMYKWYIITYSWPYPSPNGHDELWLGHHVWSWILSHNYKTWGHDEYGHVFMFLCVLKRNPYSFLLYLFNQLFSFFSETDSQFWHIFPMFKNHLSNP